MWRVYDMLLCGSSGFRWFLRRGCRREDRSGRLRGRTRVFSKDWSDFDPDRLNVRMEVREGHCLTW